MSWLSFLKSHLGGKRLQNIHAEKRVEQVGFEQESFHNTLTRMIKTVLAEVVGSKVVVGQNDVINKKLGWKATAAGCYFAATISIPYLSITDIILSISGGVVEDTGCPTSSNDFEAFAGE